MAEENGWKGNLTACNFLYLFNFAPCECATYSKIYKFEGLLFFFFNLCLLFSFPEICCSDVLVEKDELARSYVEVRLQTASLCGAVPTGRLMTTEANVSSQTARAEAASS